MKKVYDLAISIVTKGYFLNELPIVVKEKDKYHVLEGNRRVSASKILINPDLIKSATRRRNVKELLKTFDISMVQRLEVIVAPSREAADVMIVNRHTGGSSVEIWDKTKQDRFLYDRFISGESVNQMALKFPISKAEIRSSLKRYNVYKELSALELDDDIKNAVLDETTFKMTNLERVYQSTEGLDFMGFEFDDKDFSLIKKLPKEEFDKRMEKIAIDVVKGVVNSRKLNTDADKKKYFDKLIESKEFNTGIVLDAKYNEEYPKQDKSTIADEPETPLVTPRTRKSLTNLMPVNTYLESGNKRIDEIFYELKSLNLKKNPNAVSVLFRSYLDMIAYQFLKKMGGLEEIKTEDIFKLKNENDKKLIKVKSAFTKLNINIAEIPDEEFKKAIGINDSLDRKNMIPSLKFMLAHIASSTSLITDDKLRQALQSYVRNDRNLLGHNDFNLLVHNEYYTAEGDELQKIWTQLFPLFEYFVIQIKS